DVAVIQHAYDDSAGVTREFNLNLLRRINRELEGTFDVSAFRHFATFSPARRRIESYLLSMRRQTVRAAGHEYAFEPWEPLHTEISRKYREEDVEAFARQAGFIEVSRLFDTQRLFLDALWRVGPGEPG